MRFRTPAVFGFAIVLAFITGCAARQHTGTELDQWSVESYNSTTPRQTPYLEYGLSQSPSQAVAPGKADDSHRAQFDFSHPRVDNFVTQFQTNLRAFYSRALSRSGRYVPRMSSILQKKGLPQELAYLPLIESGYQPHAVSRAGAVGPWQLIPGTGRRYGLRIDRYVDERRDPVKSTEAAAEYLKDLHDMFGDWHLSLAAYNTGEQNIVRILERRRIESFWDMSARGLLYQETSDFVPEFLAALQIAETPEAYGFDAPSEHPAQYDIVKVDRALSLSTVARLTGASTSTIQELNPALHRGLVPPTGYSVRLPKGTKEGFEVALASLPMNVGIATPGHIRRRGSGHRHHRIRHGTVASAKTHHRGAQTVAKAAHAHKTRSAHAGRAARVATATRSSAPSILVAKGRSASKVLD